MEPLSVKSNKNFIGRKFELAKLTAIDAANESAIIIIYGRRRVGKTELIEQAYRERNILKFEGLEGQNQRSQFAQVLRQLAKYTKNSLFTKVQVSCWEEIFDIIAKYVATGTWTLYFEELQWMANYDTKFTSALKYAWDNYFRHNNKLLLVLCGSSPSFMVNHVIKSKALYNRSQHEFHLKPFSLAETRLFLAKKSVREIVDAYLTIGGIPEYLKRIRKTSSVFLGICENSFVANSFFSGEYEKIFISSLAQNQHYQKIIAFLSKRRFATRSQIISHLKINSGGGISEVLMELETCGLIEKYTPYNLNDNSLLARYAISDQYLQFYFKFIAPLVKNIADGNYNNNSPGALNMETYHKWLGFAFERFCRKHHLSIAKILGFSGITYKVGAYFSRATNNQDSGYQLDLVFERSDKVITICEIKYLQAKVSIKVIEEFEKKLNLFNNPRKYTIQKVLIAANGAEQTIINRGYFDRVITAEELFI